jgi:hypothetical protein
MYDLGPPIVNWVYQAFRAHSHPRAAAPDPPASNPLPNGAVHDPRYLTLPAISALYESNGRAYVRDRTTCARVGLCECSRMLAHAGPIWGKEQGSSSVQTFTCVVVEIETSVMFLDLPMRRVGESIQHEKDHSVSHSKSSVQSSAPPQLSLYPSLKVSDSTQAVTGWQATISAVEAESCLHFVRARRRGRGCHRSCGRNVCGQVA